MKIAIDSELIEATIKLLYKSQVDAVLHELEGDVAKFKNAAHNE